MTKLRIIWEDIVLDGWFHDYEIKINLLYRSNMKYLLLITHLGAGDAWVKKSIRAKRKCQKMRASDWTV